MLCVDRNSFAARTRFVAHILITLAVSLAVSSCSRELGAARGGHLEAGRKLLAQKDYARAVIELKNAVQAAPNNPEPYYQLGLANLELGDVRSAAGLFHKAAELDPKHAEAQKALARLMATSRNPEILSEAAKRLETVLTLNPADVDSFNTLASTEYRLGKTTEAEANLRRALEKNPNHVPTLTSLASLRMAAKDSEGAGRLLKQATEAAPKSPEAWIGLGRYYLATGKTAEAGAQFQKAVDVKPDDPNALFELGRFQIASKLPEKAEQTFRRMADLPQPQFRMVYGRYLFANDRKNEAIAEFQRLAAADPGTRAYRSSLVAAYFSAGRRAEAESLLDEALKKNPKDSDARLQRAELYLQTGRLTGARSDLEDTIRRRPEDATAHYLLARVYKLQGNPALQRQELSAALQHSRSLLAARVQLAAALNASGSHTAALTLLDEAPEEQKQSLPLVVERNWALIGSGDFTRARQSVAEALNKGATPELLTQDAFLDLREGRIGKARTTLQQALKLDPGNLRAVQYLAGTYFAEKQEKAAADTVRTYLTKQESPEAQLWLSEVLLRLGDRNGSRAAAMAAKRLSPDLSAVDLMLAQIDASEGKTDSARNILKGLLNSNRSIEEAAMLMGGIEQNAGNCAAASDYFHKALEINNQNWIAANNYAACLTAVGRHDEALKYAQQARELKPAIPSVVDTLGWVLYNKGLFKLASKQYDSLAGSPSAVHQYHRAMAYMKAGDLAGGRMALEQARKIDPGAAEAQMAASVYQQVSQVQQ